MSALLEVNELRVRFGGAVDALRGVSFSLERGERIAIAGESGAGKSTLAACLAGLIQPPESGGSVRLDGDELLGAPEELVRSLRWEKVALALQGAPFNPVVSVGAQVAEPLEERRGLRASHARRRARELAADACLDPTLLDRFPHQLSGGERRRATLAMVMALEPEQGVLNAPTAGLDPVTRQEPLEEMGSLAGRRGRAFAAA